jgi:hypothetical protein
MRQLRVPDMTDADVTQVRSLILDFAASQARGEPLLHANAKCSPVIASMKR